MNTATLLPALNAVLNGTAAVLLIVGYILIRRGDRTRHRWWMVAASVMSGLFLISYVLKTVLHGTTLYGGTGWLRTLYLFTLGTHLLLAMVLPVLAGLTLYHAFKGTLRHHRRIAKVTFPIWMYVSVTGVMVFLLLRPYY